MKDTSPLVEIRVNLLRAKVHSIHATKIATVETTAVPRRDSRAPATGASRANGYTAVRVLFCQTSVDGTRRQAANKWRHDPLRCR